MIVKKSIAFRKEDDYLRKMLLLLSKCLLNLNELNNTYFQVFDTRSYVRIFSGEGRMFDKRHSFHHFSRDQDFHVR